MHRVAARFALKTLTLLILTPPTVHNWQPNMPVAGLTAFQSNFLEY